MTNNPDIRLSMPLEAKADAQGVISGLAAAFGGDPDAYGDLIAPGAFKASLAAHGAEATLPSMLWAHDPARVIGRWTTFTETSEGLEASGFLNLKTDAGRDAFEHIRAGDIGGLSIGYRAVKADRQGSARVLTEIALAEVSVVAIPANNRTRVRSVKGDDVLELKSRSAFRDLLRGAGLSRGAAEKLASGGWPALASNDEMKADDLAREIRAVAAMFKG